MKFHIIEKKILELGKYDNKAGMIDNMVCGTCNASFIYVFLDSGVTPGRTTCSACGGDCFTNIAVVRHPVRSWFRPDGVDEIKAIAKAACELLDDANYDEIEAAYITHYNEGGLFCRNNEF